MAGPASSAGGSGRGSAAVGRRWLDRLRAKDPGLEASRQAVRVTVAACLGFYPCQYLLDDSVAAIYALFAAISLGALSHVVGTPRDRTRTHLAATVAGAALTVAGTYAARSDLLAAVGMFVVGFLVAFAGVGGSRLVGVSNGLQLFYILPCFPPYAADQLESRLLGIAAGGALLIAVDRLLWPRPGPERYEERLGAAARAVAAYADVLVELLRREGAVHADRALLAARDAAHSAVDRTATSAVPVMERPSSASATDRALTSGRAALRHACYRLDRVLDRRTAEPVQQLPVSAELLRAAAEGMRSAADALVSGSPPPEQSELHEALASFDEQRLPLMAGVPPDELVRVLRVVSTVAQAAGAALAVVDATRVARGLPIDSATAPAGDSELAPFWYAGRSRAALYWSRLRLHLSWHSVLLQNALRVATALAAARLLAGVLDLSHGFWVLLATLSLMRTSASDSRTTLRPAFVGTLVGALVAAGTLTAASGVPRVYEWVTPPVMVLAFAMGPLLGLAYAQASFTVVVCLVFVQVAPASWRLAEARFIDVVVGGVTGAVIGLLAWPRGGGGQLRRSVSHCLDLTAAAVQETAALVADRVRPAGADLAARRATVLAEAAQAQYDTERPDPRLNGRDLGTLLVLSQRMLRSGEFLQMRYPEDGSTPGPDRRQPRGFVRAAATDVHAAVEGLAGAVREGRPPPVPSLPDRTPAEMAWLRSDLATGRWDDGTLRVVEAMAWLDGLEDDLRDGGLAAAGRGARAGGPAAGAAGPAGVAGEAQPRR